MAFDESVDFGHVGGAVGCLLSLKVSLILPWKFKQIFLGLGIGPLQDVLFIGLQGTGKTLLARASANEYTWDKPQWLGFLTSYCIFVRKGADRLSKWVGESKCQGQLLFDHPFGMRLTIIFSIKLMGSSQFIHPAWTKYILLWRSRQNWVSGS